MERIGISVKVREKTGKGIARRIRVSRSIPAIIYGDGLNLPIELSAQAIKALQSIHFSESTIVDVAVVDASGDEKDKFAVVIKDIQHDPLSDQVIHLDFMKVSLDEVIRVNVPLILKGEPKGVKEGAVCEQIMRDVEVEGLPLDIPEKIEVDITHLEQGHSLHMRDIKVPDKIKVITQPEKTIATLLIKKEEEEAAPEEEMQAAEPEVIKEKKEEEPKAKEKQG
ncbi:MAG: 50S ribosomal protein L25 [Candidatus Omnitrophota bacterium]